MKINFIYSYTYYIGTKEPTYDRLMDLVSLLHLCTVYNVYIIKTLAVEYNYRVA